MNSRINQKGITITGLLMACIVFGALALGVMKLWPVYNEKLKVDLALEKIAATPESNRMGRVAISRLLQRQFDVDGIEPVPANKLAKTIKLEKEKGTKTKILSLVYEIRAPLTSELDVILNYNKSVALNSEKTD